MRSVTSGRRDSVVELDSHAPRFRNTITFLVVLIILAIALYWTAVELEEGGSGQVADALRTLAEAFATAVVLGFGYELVTIEEREKHFKGMFESHRRRISDHIDAMALLSLDEVFQLLRNIVKTLDRAPTLFRRTRGPFEVGFADSTDFFGKLINAKRSEATSTLRQWLYVDHDENLRFLASDFVGFYTLDELAETVREIGLSEFTELESKLIKLERTDGGQEEIDRVLAKKGWVLNYLWACSRCEKPKYRTICDLLLATDSVSIQGWLLFVPLQMPDAAFLSYLNKYVAKRGRAISPENKRLLVQVLETLEKHNIKSGKLTAAKVRKELETMTSASGQGTPKVGHGRG